tara:strand:- start:97 stop:252 length:156 start_codon:yes stop_codon:yes gene_type:complete
MRLYEYRQSATSPLKYHLELRPEELETVKDLVMEIIDRIKQDEDNKVINEN